MSKNRIEPQTSELMDKEPPFGVYLKSRDDTPDSVDEIRKDGFAFERIPADEVIWGWDNLEDFLDNSEDGYYWKEAEPETAPERVVCEECDSTVKTHSDERLDHLRYMHHISTGH